MRKYRATPEGKEATRRMEKKRIVTQDRIQKMKVNIKQWAASPKGKASLRLANKKFKQNNKEKLLDAEKQRRATNIKFKLAANLRRRLREIFARKGYTKKSRSYEILGCDYETFLAHIEKQFLPGMSWDNFGEWELDHIYPVAKASTKQEIVMLNHFTNIQPMWGYYNKLKQDLLPDDWRQYMIVNGIDVSVKPNRQAERGAACLFF
jgi:hypothetical protein